MPKVHVTDDGPKLCQAQEGNCPKGGAVHFEGDQAWSQAAKHFEKSQGSQLPTSQKKKPASKPRKAEPKEKVVDSNPGEDSGLATKNLSGLIPRRQGVYSALQGNTLEEMKRNLDESYERLSKEPRMSEGQYKKKVDVAIQMMPAGDDPTMSYDVMNLDLREGTVEVYISSHEFDFAEEDVLSANYIGDLEDDGEVIEDGSSRGNEHYAVRRYSIPDDDRAAMKNHYDFEEMKALKSRMDNPDYPAWSVLPPQTSLEHRKTLSTPSLMERRDLDGRLNQLEAEEKKAVARVKRTTTLVNKYREQKGVVDSLQKQREDLSNAMGMLGESAAAKKAREGMRKELVKVDSDLKEATIALNMQSDPGEKLREAEEHLEITQGALNKHREVIRQKKLEYLVKDLARHYPSKDPKECQRAAEKWVGDHFDAVERYNNELAH